MEVKSNEYSFPKFLGLMAIAYLFAIAVRYIWVQWAGQNPEFFWNGQIMINTNDGYYWAEGARDILAGHHQPHDLSPVDEPISKLTAFLASVLPFKFETIILWMPAMFGSLIVVPIMLIGRALKEETMGFLAALLAGIAWSYYNRTMTGYYDTDMLTIVLPTFVLWGLIKADLERKNRYMLLLAFMILLYQWWYPSAAPLNTAFAGVYLLYAVIFDRKNLYHYKLLLFMVIAVTPMGLYLKLALLLALFLFFHYGKERADRAVWPLLGLAAVLFVATGGLNPIWYQVKGYLLREAVNDEVANAVQLHFFAVSKTVREAGQIPFELFANRISGHPVTFILSVIGYILLSLRYRVMWLALPMLGLGFLAMKGGLRFTVYAVPVCALGFAWLVVLIARKIAHYAPTEKGERVYFYTIVAFLTAAALWPNISHVQAYKVPTVFTRSEVVVLDKLKHKAHREDYVLAWWDYGYPIRYYSDVKTLIDGGKHTGEVNFPVSFALTRPQIASANMARLDVEYTEMAYKKDRNGTYLQMMMEDYGYKDPEKFLKALNDPNFKLPVKSREIYYYLPLRMLDIYPTVAIFSDIDLKSGKVKNRPLFYVARRFQDTKDRINLGNGVVLNKTNGLLQIGKRQIPLNSFIVTEITRRGKLRVKRQEINPESPIFIIYMKSYNRFLVLDRKMFDSTFIQLFVLGQYNHNLFEPIIVSPMAMVYRLKK